MIEKSDIITCKSYQPLCDYLYDGPDLEDIPPTGLVHVHMDVIDEFFKRIDSNGHRYVVVSSCSDFGLAIQSDHPPWKDVVKWAGMRCGPGLGYQGITINPRLDAKKCSPKDTYSVKCHPWTRATLPSIPHNVHHWFVGNLMFVPEPETYDFLYEGNMYEKITAIPFGIAEGKEEYVHKASQKVEPENKKNKIYVSWNDYNLERHELRQELVEWQSYAGLDSLTVRYPKEGQDTYEDYIENLRTHKYVVSPPGNGADCYRTLESIYMGCLTLVQDTPTNYLTDLPVHRYKTADDIIRSYNDGSYDKPNLLRRVEKTRLSYWSNLIKEKAAEMFI